MQKRLIAAYISISLVSLAFVMAFFLRPHAPNVELVTLQQELPDPNAHYITESGLRERVSKSYGIALVLVISEYSRKNAVALEAVRRWAHDNFLQNPGFLHIRDHDPVVAHNSMLDAFSYSLLAPPRYFLEQQALNFLKNQIALFHTTKSYQTFRADYFDSFGLDRESANMLAQYQSERAEKATGVVLSAVYWLVALVIGVRLHFRVHNQIRSSRWQRSLAFFWFATALFYIIVAWACNDVSVLVSSIVCALAGLYLRRPIAISFGEDKSFSFRLLMPSRAVLSAATWATFTLIAVQVLTWLRTGTMASPDPITLFVSSVTGDFLHEPATAKKYVSSVTGILWLVVTGICVFVAAHESRSLERNLERALAPIDDNDLDSNVSSTRQKIASGSMHQR